MANSDSSTAVADKPSEAPPNALPELKTVHESVPNPDKQLDPPPPKSREELLAQAEKFLETDTVKRAPDAEKREFLGAKGLTVEEIDALMTKLIEKAKDKKEAAKKAIEEIRKGKGKGKEEAEVKKDGKEMVEVKKDGKEMVEVKKDGKEKAEPKKDEKNESKGENKDGKKKEKVPFPTLPYILAANLHSPNLKPNPTKLP
jgi:Pex14 N-terminal domain